MSTSFQEKLDAFKESLVNSIEDDKNNPHNIDISDYLEITYEELEPHNNKRKNMIVIRTIGIMISISVCIYYFDKIIIGNIGLSVFIMCLYLMMHIYFLSEKVRKIHKHDYKRCHECKRKTVQILKYNSSDYDTYFCINCKTYFRIYHVALDLS